jgi:hypothetical protein
VGYHPWPELGAAVRNATPHADADATAIEILGLVMARFTFYKSNDRLIERPHPADYDLDQLRMMECGSHLERRPGVYASGALAAESDWRSLCRVASLVRLGALRRRSETNNGFAIETRKRVELRTIFVRLAAQHCKPTERAMPNGRSRLTGHWGDVF